MADSAEIWYFSVFCYAASHDLGWIFKTFWIFWSTKP